MKEILQHLSSANQQLQHEKCNLLSAASLKAVKRMRDDETFKKLLSESGADSSFQDEKRPT